MSQVNDINLILRRDSTIDNAYLSAASRRDSLDRGPRKTRRGHGPPPPGPWISYPSWPVRKSTSESGVPQRRRAGVASRSAEQFDSCTAADVVGDDPCRCVVDVGPQANAARLPQRCGILTISFRRELRTESEVQLSILARELLQERNIVGVIRAWIALLREDASSLRRACCVAGAEQS